MDKTKSYIIELLQVMGDETTIYLETNADAVISLFAIVEILDGGASIVDNCYHTIGEARSAWLAAIPRKAYHLTPSAIEENCTIHSEKPRRRVTC